HHGVGAEDSDSSGRGEGAAAGYRGVGERGGAAGDQPFGQVRGEGAQDGQFGEEHPADGADDGGDGAAGDVAEGDADQPEQGGGDDRAGEHARGAGGEVGDAAGGQLDYDGGQAEAEGQAAEHHPGGGGGDGFGGDQGAAPRGDEHGRDDGLVPVFAAGGDDAQHQHGHGGNRAELEHLVGAGCRSEGRGAVLAGTPRVEDDADHGGADRQGEGGQEGQGWCERSEH